MHEPIASLRTWPCPRRSPPLPPGGVLGENRIDRLLHHAHLVLTKGDSHRLAAALAGKGVIPMAT
jgi:hypothetical protein